WSTFSSSVIRETRSTARRSGGKFGSRYGALPGCCADEMTVSDNTIASTCSLMQSQVARKTDGHKSRSQGVNLEYVRVIAGWLIGQVYRDSFRTARPGEIGFRAPQPDSGDCAAVMRGIRS